jgi:hypothetical protein
MLTTLDNPHDYFTDFRAWFMLDVDKGYNTCSLLARIAKLSDDFTEKETNEAIEKAIDEIIKYDFMNIYKKVYRNDGSNKSIVSHSIAQSKTNDPAIETNDNEVENNQTLSN